MSEQRYLLEIHHPAFAEVQAVGTLDELAATVEEQRYDDLTVVDRLTLSALSPDEEALAALTARVKAPIARYERRRLLRKTCHELGGRLSALRDIAKDTRTGDELKAAVTRESVMVEGALTIASQRLREDP